MVFVKWKVPLPFIQLHWKKPPCGNDTLHSIYLADICTTALGALKLILLCPLPEQTFIRKCELEGRGEKNKDKE